MAHLLFLSHAGADTERALRLAAAIEASPEAQAATPSRAKDALANLHALAQPMREKDQ